MSHEPQDGGTAGLSERSRRGEKKSPGYSLNPCASFCMHLLHFYLLREKKKNIYIYIYILSASWSLGYLEDAT